jgi:hypothetical protein
MLVIGLSFAVRKASTKRGKDLLQTKLITTSLITTSMLLRVVLKDEHHRPAAPFQAGLQETGRSMSQAAFSRLACLR